jgi:hypothetical protein
LGGYAAKQCAMRVQHDFGPAPIKWVAEPEEQARLDAGIEFEAEVFGELLSRRGGAVLIDSTMRRAAAIATTVAAMDAAVPLILGGWLPDDPVGGRTGRPDVLVAVPGGYLPADVKHHRSAEPKPTKTAALAGLDQPADWELVAGWSSATTYRMVDGLQLAHYTRLLESCGRHPGPHLRYGAVLGTTTADRGNGCAERMFVWHDLTEPLALTFSRSRGKARRSLLDRYDHEHGFRLAIARAANAGGDLLVTPVGQPECRSCPYREVCAEQMGAEDPSAVFTVGNLDVREWIALRRLGITTVDALADLDPAAPEFFTAYHREVSHRTPSSARARLSTASQRARMIRDRTPIVALDQALPGGVGADVEIDCDIEWGADGRVYLWGARVRLRGDDSTAVFVPFVDWSALDAAGERALAERFAGWLRGLRDICAMAGRTVRVYHWSAAERTQLHRILGCDAADLIDPVRGIFTDLERVFTTHFLSVHGSSIKVVAPEFGFSWSAPDAGGAISQTHLAAVRGGRAGAEDSKRWLLAYNADDAAAVAAVRDVVV